LIPQTYQVAFTGAVTRIVGLVMLKLFQVNITFKFPVDAMKQVQVKPAGNTRTVIIGLSN
jgi:hypothetical protein